jgi:amidophosphoribosyltransferase
MPAAQGEESAGIATAGISGVRCHKGMGLCAEVFRDSLESLLGGRMGIGHVRYSTAGESHSMNAQPLVMSYRGGKMAIAHNGNLVNASVLRERLENEGAIFQTTIDTEIMAALIARYSKDGIVGAVTKMMDKVRGSYALVLMAGDGLIGVRDPMGIRPLALGKLDNSYVLASESCAFDAIDAEFIRDVRPGEIVVINGDGLRSYQAHTSRKTASCIFEYCILRGRFPI